MSQQEDIAPWIISLRSPDAWTRQEAAIRLGEIGNPDAVPALIQAFEDGDPEVRWYVVEALVKFPEEAVEPLTEALQSDNPHIRLGAVTALEDIAHARAVPALIQVLEDEMIGERAVAGLRAIGKPSVEPLITALQDHAPTLRRRAVETLGEIADPRAVPTLLELLSEHDNELRLSAVMALGKIADRRAVDRLLQALDDASPAMREQAAHALGRIGDPRALPTLRKKVGFLSREDPDVKRACKEAIARIEGKR